jgi:hypothetical protein
MHKSAPPHKIAVYNTHHNVNTLLRTDGNPVANRATQYLLHRIFITLFLVQVAVFFISLPVRGRVQRGSATVCALLMFKEYSKL